MNCPRCGSTDVVHHGDRLVAKPGQTQAPVVMEVWRCVDCVHITENVKPEEE